MIHFLFLTFCVLFHYQAYSDKAAVPGVNRNHLHKAQSSLSATSRTKSHSASNSASLDDKIELNRRMNATLEAMAQTLFRAWFVDFEPVKAKAAGVLPAGMDAATAALFPDSFEPSTLGMIPKGWEVSEFPNEIDFLEGPGSRNWQYTESGMKFLNIRCINDGDLDVSKATSISEEEFAQKSHISLCAKTTL